MRSLFHIGYIKCGSTTLQDSVLLSAPNLMVAPRELLEILRTPTDPDLAKFDQIFNFYALQAAREGKSIVVSHEGAAVYGVEPWCLLDRIYKISDKNEIVLFVRPQHEIMRSLY